MLTQENLIDLDRTDLKSCMCPSAAPVPIGRTFNQPSAYWIGVDVTDDLKQWALVPQILVIPTARLPESKDFSLAVVGS